MQDSLLWISLAIGLGAIPGALSRYYLTLWWTTRLGPGFPYGTCFVNVSGSLLIGWCAANRPQLEPLLPPFWAVTAIGFLGAYTTFSTYILDTANLFRAGRPRLALLYWCGCPIGGWLGITLGQRLGQ